MSTSNLRRPTPPPGFVRFRWDHTTVLSNGHRYRAPRCPNCCAPNSEEDDWGYAFGASGWQDPEAQALADAGQSTRVLAHWSRYAYGRCLVCGCEFWHDFVCDEQGRGYHYYYKPTRGQLALL